MTPSTPPDPDKNRNDPSKDTDDGTGNKDPETPESLPVKTSSDVSTKQMDSSPNPPSSDSLYVSDYSNGEIAKMIEDSLPNRKIEREYEEHMLREKAGDRTLSSPTTTQEDVPIPNNETLLPGFTSTHAKANVPTGTDDEEPTKKPPAKDTNAHGKPRKKKDSSSSSKKQYHRDIRPFTTKRVPGEKAVKKAGKRVYSKKRVKRIKKEDKTVRRKKKSTTCTKKKGIYVGATVSGRFGKFLPLEDGKKRRVRKKVLGKVIKIVGKNKYEIMYLDGNTDIKQSNVLTLEEEISFDNLREKGCKVQSHLDDDTSSKVGADLYDYDPYAEPVDLSHYNQDNLAVPKADNSEDDNDDNIGAAVVTQTQNDDDNDEENDGNDSYGSFPDLGNQNDYKDDDDDHSSFDGVRMDEEDDDDDSSCDGEDVYCHSDSDDTETRTLRCMYNNRKKRKEHEKKMKDAQTQVDNLVGKVFVVKRDKI